MLLEYCRSCYERSTAIGESSAWDVSLVVNAAIMMCTDHTLLSEGFREPLRPMSVAHEVKQLLNLEVSS